MNVVGGIRIMETSADLASLLALISSYKDIPIPNDLAALGEVGLSGEIRSVSHLNQRLSEIQRMGFKRCLIPRHIKADLKTHDGLEIIKVKNIREAIIHVF
jgi:DNA repair protein RadA/Sms